VRNRIEREQEKKNAEHYHAGIHSTWENGGGGTCGHEEISIFEERGGGESRKGAFLCKAPPENLCVTVRDLESGRTELILFEKKMHETTFFRGRVSLSEKQRNARRKRKRKSDIRAGKGSLNE